MEMMDVERNGGWRVEWRDGRGKDVKEKEM